MTDTAEHPRELVLDRLLDAPVAAVWRCWTETDLLKQWFAPKPWSIARVTLDPRPGGVFHVIMRAPDGQENDDGPGVVLEAIPLRRLVFTDAFAPGWLPGDGAPFMVADVNFADEGARTRYIARVRHWTTEAADRHRQMGFAEGWGASADQLEALARAL